MKYRDLIKALVSAGWYMHHQSASSHMVFRHRARSGSIVVAGGGKLGRDVPEGTKNAILRQAGLK